MKKIVIASLIALATMSASALEVGATAGIDYSATDRAAYGITLGQKYGVFGVTAGVDRAVKGSNDQTRYSFLGSRDVGTVGTATVAVKAGAAYLDNQTSASGYALFGGVGASIPLTDTVSATVDYTYQRGQERVQAFNGSRITAGLKVSF